VSESNSVAASRSSSRAFLRVLFLGSLSVFAVLAMENTHVQVRQAGAARRPILIRLIGEPAPAQPSAYDEESTMGPSQLLNRWNGIIAEASTRFHVPQSWIRAVMARESGGRTMLGESRPIVSRAGAVGLMQVLPETYEEMAAEHKLGSNPFDARDNIMAGAAYLRWLHHKYGYPDMFAAYNAGPGRLEDHLAHGVSLPAETRAYVGGIAKTLKFQTGKSGLDLVKLTRPDGQTVKIDPAQVVAIRPAQPGEYADSVKTIVILAKHKHQAIQEEVVAVTAALRTAGKLI
jgi:hypothetical protein